MSLRQPYRSPFYFLSEVWSSGNDGQKLPTTNRESELAAMRTPPVHATIAAAQ
jgi:hypothetical protein